MKLKILNFLIGLAILNVLLVISYSYFKYYTISRAETKKSLQKQALGNNVFLLNATSTKYSQEQKILAIKSLKELSLDESAEVGVRATAGQMVVGTFFNYGMALSKGFSTTTPNERDIYNYAKYVSTLGDSERNSLLTAYIGLRFYDKEETKESITELLHSYQRYVKNNSSSNPCGNGSKFASVIYLSQKSKHADVSEEFGDYYSNFEKTINDACHGDGKILPEFMWLAAISDIGTTQKEYKKGMELVTLVTKDISQDSPLVKNLRSSYFVNNKEPDTESIVTRLISTSPAFATFIETIKP